MATFFSDTVIGYWSSSNNTQWGTLTGDVSRSGNTVTLSNLALTTTTRYSSWGTSNDYIEIAGTGTNITVSFGSGSTSSGPYYLNNASLTVGASDTSATVSWGYWGQGEKTGEGTFTISFPSGQSAPTGIAIANLSSGTNTVSATVSVTGWGGAGDATTRYRELQVWTFNDSSLVEPRRYAQTYGNTLSSTITVDNNSLGTLTLTPNTKYTVGIWASNGTYNTGSQRRGTVVTLAEAPTVSVSAVTTDSITISYSQSADGGYYEKTIQYSLDGGNTWVTGATIASGAATTGTFTISGLVSGASYAIQTRATTSAGNTAGSTITAQTTPAEGTTIGFYGPASGLSAKTWKFYGAAPSMEVTGVTGSIDSGAETVTAFDANVFWSKHTEFESLNVSSLEVTWGGGGGTIYLYFTDSPDPQTLVGPNATIADCAGYGVTISGRKAMGDYISLTPVYSPTGPTATTPIIKLYGSVRGTTTTGNVAKLIYQAGC